MSARLRPSRRVLAALSCSAALVATGAMGVMAHADASTATPDGPASPQLPTILPSLPTLLPTILPTILPTGLPTILPTILPTTLPTGLPTILPTLLPTGTSTPNTPPVVIASAKPATVLAGQPVKLSAKGTRDAQTPATQLKYSWNYGNGGGKVDSTKAQPTVTFNKKGVYHVVLSVTDPQKAVSVKTMTITVLKRLDCQAGTVTKQGPWQTAYGSGSRGGAYCDNLKKVAKPKPSVLTVHFVGPMLRIDFGKATGGGTAALFVDGTKNRSISFAGTGAKPSFTKTVTMKGFSAGKHTLRMVVTGTAYVDTFVW